VIVHWDGNSWTVTPHLVNLLSVAGPTAVGEYGNEGSGTDRWGSGWSARYVLFPGFARSVWTPGFGILAVGDGGNIAFSTEPGIAGSWGLLKSGSTATLNAVWGLSPGESYAVGAGGYILQATSASAPANPFPGKWSSQQIAFGDFHGVWGSSATDVYAVGGSTGAGALGFVFHSVDHGTTWNPLSQPALSKPMFAVSGNSATNLYAVGAAGTIYHSTGNNQWAQESSPTTQDLLGVWVAANNDAFAVGKAGTILRKTTPLSACTMTCGANQICVWNTCNTPANQMCLTLSPSCQAAPSCGCAMCPVGTGTCTAYQGQIACGPPGTCG
jgi:hypothetical protein